MREQERAPPPPSPRRARRRLGDELRELEQKILQLTGRGDALARQVRELLREAVALAESAYGETEELLGYRLPTECDIHAVASAVAWGEAQFDACIADIRRAADHGFRSVLIADIGVLAAFSRMKAGGELPEEMTAKIFGSSPKRLFVSGDDLCWHGFRTLEGLERIRELRARIASAGDSGDPGTPRAPAG